MKNRNIWAPGTFAVVTSTHRACGYISYFVSVHPVTKERMMCNPYQGIPSVEKWPYDTHRAAIGQLVMLLAVEKDKARDSLDLQLLVGERAGWTFIKRRVWLEMVTEFEKLLNSNKP